MKYDNENGPLFGPVIAGWDEYKRDWPGEARSFITSFVLLDKRDLDEEAEERSRYDEEDEDDEEDEEQLSDWEEFLLEYVDGGKPSGYTIDDLRAFHTILENVFVTLIEPSPERRDALHACLAAMKGHPAKSTLGVEAPVQAQRASTARRVGAAEPTPSSGTSSSDPAEVSPWAAGTFGSATPLPRVGGAPEEDTESPGGAGPAAPPPPASIDATGAVDPDLLRDAMARAVPFSDQPSSAPPDVAPEQAHPARGATEVFAARPFEPETGASGSSATAPGPGHASSRGDTPPASLSTVDGYAWLCAEVERYSILEIFARYGLTEASFLELRSGWEERLAADPALSESFRQRYEASKKWMDDHRSHP